MNEAYELLLQYFAAYSSSIGFPELAYPSVVRVSQVKMLCAIHVIVIEMVFLLYSCGKCASQSHFRGSDFS